MPDLTPEEFFAKACDALHMEFLVTSTQALQWADHLWRLVPPLVAAAAREDDRDPVELVEASPPAREIPESRRIELRHMVTDWKTNAEARLGELFDTIDVEKLPEAPDLYTVMTDPWTWLLGIADLSAVTRGAESLTAPPGPASLTEAAYFRTYMNALEPTSWGQNAVLRGLWLVTMNTLEPAVRRVVGHLLLARSPARYRSFADHRLEDDVRERTFGSPDRKWRTALIDLNVLDVSEAVDWVQLQRLWEDRDVVVHHRGMVDLRHETRTGTEPGTLVEFTVESVQATIDRVSAARYSLSLLAWRSLDPGAARLMLESTPMSTWTALRDGRWRLAFELARLCKACATMPETVASAHVDGWLARLSGEGFDSIRPEVEAWAVESLPPEYRMAKHLLLGEDSAGMSLAYDLLKAGRLTPQDVANWPLFDGPRTRGVVPDPTDL